MSSTDLVGALQMLYGEFGLAYAKVSLTHRITDRCFNQRLVLEPTLEPFRCEVEN